MVASIPASAIVDIVPSVVSAGGAALDVTGLFLTNSLRVPVGTVLEFTSAATVTAYFGATSAEAALANIYFGGFDGSQVKPGKLMFAGYATAPGQPSQLRGGKVTNLAALQANSGTLTLTINGASVTSSSVNFATATSFSQAASMLQAAINNYDAPIAYSMTIAGNTMTVTGTPTGIAVGQTVTGSGVAPGTVITALGTGTGGAGTYTVTPAQSVAALARSGATTVTYDSVSQSFVIQGGTPGSASTLSYATGALATPLALGASNGGAVYNGSIASVPATAMDAALAATQNFVSFSTVFEPSTADCVAFASWANTQGNRYLYVMWDTDVTVTTPSNTLSAGYAITQAGYSGTALVYSPINQASAAAFLMGAIASIDFQRAQGRATLAFKSLGGLTADVMDRGIGDQLITNGYNFFGAYATAAQRFQFFYPGSVTGPFAWIDSYVNQVWMSNGFELALMSLLASVRSIPYNAVGYAMIEAALADPITLAVSFGAIRNGVRLSNAQVSNINNSAGQAIDQTLFERGWNLQVLPPSSAVRGARGTPIVNFWYVDGQSVQKIQLNSVEVQ